MSQTPKRFTSTSFQLEELLDAARELKYTKEIKRILGEQLSKPAEDFVRFFQSQVYSGRNTSAIRQQFQELTKPESTDGRREDRGRE